MLIKSTKGGVAFLRFWPIVVNQVKRIIILESDRKVFFVKCIAFQSVFYAKTGISAV